MPGPTIQWTPIDTTEVLSEIREEGRYRLASPSAVKGAPSLAMQAAGQNCTVKVYIGGVYRSDALLTVPSTAPVAIRNAVGQPLTGQEMFDMVIEVGNLGFGSVILTTDEPNGSPSAPFATVEKRTEWATANLATLLPGRTTAWGPGVSTEYVWNGPLATDWVAIPAIGQNILGSLPYQRNLFILGDSVSSFTQSGGYIAQAILKSNGFFRVAKNAATPSMGIAHVLSTQLPLMASYTFDEVWCEIGTNDTGAVGTFEAQFRTLVSALVKLGKPLRFYAIPPKTGAGAAVSQINNIQRKVLYENGLCLYDIWELIRAYGDTPIAGGTVDGTHPANAACVSAADKIIDIEQAARYPMIPVSADNVAGGVFENPALADSGSGLASSLTLDVSNIGAGACVASIRADSRGFNWQDLTITNLPATKSVVLYAKDAGAGPVGIPVVAGKTYRFTGKVSLSGPLYFAISTRWYTVAPALSAEYYFLQGQVTISDGRFEFEVVCPETCVWLRPFFSIGNHSAASAAASGVFSLALPNVVDVAA